MVAAVQVFLLEGVQAGLRVGYVGRVGPVVTAPAAEWARREGRSDAVFSLDLAGTYLPDGVVSPQRQVKVFRHATELALADGFAGLRVAADATDLVRTPEQLDAFVRYEHVIDRYMADQPFSGLCAFDRGRLGDAATDLACVHPICNDHGSSFGVFASAGDAIGLRGEFDGFEHERFERVLGRVTATIANRDLIIDATDLDFVDHHALLTIREHAHDRAGSATILSRSSSGLCRLVEILDLGPDVVVETVV